MRPSRYMRTLLAATATIAVLILPAGASAAQTPDQILSDLAAKQTHSWIDNSTGVTAQLAWYKAGGRLNITCGYVSELARRLLVEQGYTARRVETITLEPYNNLSDGHAMVEVFYQGHWQLYDVDANAKAVDATGNPIQLTQQVAAVKAGDAHWQTIATDPLYREDEPDPVLRDLAERIFTDPDAFYERVMGFALLPTDGAGVGWKMYYIEASQTGRLQALRPDHFVLASAATWRNLNASLTTAAATTVVTPKPVPVSTAPVVAAANPPAVKRSCQRLKRQYKRTHTRRAWRKYRRCRASR